MPEMPLHSPTTEALLEQTLLQCPVCCHPRSIFLCTKDSYHIFACPECGSEYVVNPPSTNELKDYYSREEWFQCGEIGGYKNYDEQSKESLKNIRTFLERFSGKTASILDVGCGYGNHLKIAAELGWKCFGVEPSEHARAVAIERLGSSAMIVSTSEELIPHPFDVILMLDVIEHVSDPYSLFYPLFAAGAIQRHTVILVTTPNAGSISARIDPVNWIYRHPPSHLTYFTYKSLTIFFQALRFTSIKVEGIHPINLDKDSDIDIKNYAGLLLEANGSDFQEFMQERYVPSTWSEIAEYEHLPRYELACIYARSGQVLDFGCGTGYGTAMLAKVAGSALGVDIDESALEWARRCHQRSNLLFQHNGDFLADFKEGTFDLVTCFEMIEHVTELDQYKVVHALAKVLKTQGILIISTPNPDITSLYGNNPYHLRERTRDEFLDLLKEYFRFIHIIDQRALTGIFFSGNDDNYEIKTINGQEIQSAKPLAYIAICSHTSLPSIMNRGYLDSTRDYISSRIRHENAIIKSRLDTYQIKEISANLKIQLDSDRKILSNLKSQITQSNQIQSLNRDTISSLEKQLETRIRQISELSIRGAELERILDLERRSRWARLGQRLRATGLIRSALLQRAMAVASSLRRQMWQLPTTTTFNQHSLAPAVLEPSEQAYTINQPKRIATNRPTILHAIANFCLGGSSRLVVDLIESLSESFEQPVVTRYIPHPPAYLNLTLHEYSQPASPEPFLALIDHYKPSFVHIHYWGDCDQDWYEHVFHACEARRIPVIQNINTPVTPYVSPAIYHNVYVSDYVRKIYGSNDAKALVIHPGSDLNHFSVKNLSDQPDNYIGMVYRLETDKLNSNSIDVFIKVALRRPATRCLIIGDGSLKPVFEQMVKQAGVSDNFIFTGYVSYQDLPDFYRQMSLFVAPVWKESFGQVSSFAMNMGLPVVGYSIGAIPSIIDDDKLIVDYGDSDGLADLIIRLLDDRTQRLEIGRRNHQKAQAEYSITAMIKGYSNLYFSMLSIIPNL